MEEYTDSSKLRPLMLAVASFIPFVGNTANAADELVVQHVERARRERFESLLQELDTGAEDFGGPIPVYRSDPLFHAAYITIEATLRTQRRQKIRAFARLLLSALGGEPAISLETEHEDFLKIVDDLSSREIGMLVLLNKYESSHPRPENDENEYAWTDRYWDDFELDLRLHLGFPAEEISGALTRLARTGLYEQLGGSYYDIDPSGRGKLTGTYKRISEIMRTDADYFDSGRIL